MAQRILVFESDNDFATEVQSRFRRAGAEVEVVADGAEGLDRASASPPNLILLSIELPSMNGFLVCKKIKKANELKDIPLVILSSDANADEIFEQHKKLRTRAEEYIKKPVAADELFDRVRGLVSLPAGGDAPAPEVVVEDATDILSREQVDREIEAFAENAFDSLVLEDDGLVASSPAARAPAEAVARASSERPAATSHPPDMTIDEDADDLLDDIEIEAEAEATGTDESDAMPATEPPHAESAPPPAPAKASVRPSAPPRASVPAPARDTETLAALDEARARIASLEGDLERARRAEAEVATLKSQVADLQRASAKAGGVSSRDFLDLREQLNKKDKEILELRDQMSARDKQIIELKDQNLHHAREKADYDDRVIELERGLATAEETIEALRADKDSVTKRADDLKGRLERSEAKARKLEDDLDAERAERAAEKAALEADKRDALEAAEAKRAADLASLRDETAADKKRALEEATAAHERELTATRERGEEELAQAKAAHASAVDELRAEHAARAAAASESHAEALRKAREEAAADKEAALEAERTAHATTLAGELAAAEARRAADVDAATNAGREALASREAELVAQHESERKKMEDDTARQLAVLGRKLADTEGKMTAAQERAASFETDLASARASIASLEEEKSGLLANVASLEGEKSRLENELSSARASIAELERTVEDRSARIVSLEDDVARLEHRIAQAESKIATDDALLERVRKAMAIGVGLLEQQKDNRIGPGAEAESAAAPDLASSAPGRPAEEGLRAAVAPTGRRRRELLVHVDRHGVRRAGRGALGGRPARARRLGRARGDDRLGGRDGRGAEGARRLGRGEGAREGGGARVERHRRRGAHPGAEFASRRARRGQPVERLEELACVGEARVGIRMDEALDRGREARRDVRRQRA